MQKNIAEKIFFIIFLLVGIIMLITGIFTVKSELSFESNAIKTEATITKIIKDRDSDGDYYYTVYVDYTVDGETYHNKINEYNYKMHEGGTTTIYYHSNDPYYIKDSSISFVMFVPLIIGIIFSLCGGIPLLIFIKKGKNAEYLMKNGNSINVEFDRIEINRSYTVNGRSPYRIVCHGIGNDYNEYESENIWINPERYIADKNITNFVVYVDPENPKKYCMPLEELNEIIKK